MRLLSSMGLKELKPVRSTASRKGRMKRAPGSCSSLPYTPPPGRPQSQPATVTTAPKAVHVCPQGDTCACVRGCAGGYLANPLMVRARAWGSKPRKRSRAQTSEKSSSHCSPGWKLSLERPCGRPPRTPPPPHTLNQSGRQAHAMQCTHTCKACCATQIQPQVTGRTMYACMYVCIHVYMYVCMYVCEHVGPGWLKQVTHVDDVGERL
jgi:hypothetical protein